jgi:hypothetical protein
MEVYLYSFLAMLYSDIFSISGGGGGGGGGISL